MANRIIPFRYAVVMASDLNWCSGSFYGSTNTTIDGFQVATTNTQILKCLEITGLEATMDKVTYRSGSAAFAEQYNTNLQFGEITLRHAIVESNISPSWSSFTTSTTDPTGYVTSGGLSASPSTEASNITGNILEMWHLLNLPASYKGDVHTPSLAPKADLYIYILPKNFSGDPSLTNTIGRIKVKKAFVNTYKVGDLSADSGEVWVEEATIKHSGFVIG